MFDENSIIYAYFDVKESKFELFLNNYFDASGNCLINGVIISKQEVIDEMDKIKEKNVPLIAKEREMEAKAFNETLRILDQSGEEISEEIINRHIEKMTNPDPIFLHDLSVKIKLDVKNYSEEQICEMFANDCIRLDDDNDLGIKRINLDIAVYGLESIVTLKRIGNPFMSENEKSDKINDEETKRKNIVEEILKYKRKLDAIDTGVFGNESSPNQMSGGRHI